MVFIKTTNSLVAKLLLSNNCFRTNQPKLIPSPWLSSRVVYASNDAFKSSSRNSERNVTVSNDRSEQNKLSSHVKVTERIKQTGKDVTYLAVILTGVGVTGVVFYFMFKEFFSSKSPSSVFASALKKCKEDPRIVEALGEPIKGRGEMTSRGRARHVSSIEYENEGRTYLRVIFYLKGSKASATVQCETDKQSDRGSFRYLFAQLDYYPNTVIVVEDNRRLDNQ